MHDWKKAIRSGLHTCADTAVTLLCWCVWIVLGLLLCAQIGIATTRQFRVPRFVLHAFEERFAASGVTARFGRTTFDPTGGVVLEDLRLSLPAFPEPVISARAVYIELDPWALVLARVEARRVQATGVKLFIPAMVAPTGRNEEAISDLEFDVMALDQALDVKQLTTRAAGVAVTLHGRLNLEGNRKRSAVSPVPLLEKIAANYGSFSREIGNVMLKLSGFDDPRLDATLLGSASRSAVAAVTFSARSIALPGFKGLRARDVRAQARVPILSHSAKALVPVSIQVGELESDFGSARQIDATGTGELTGTTFFPQPVALRATIAEALGRGLVCESAIVEAAVRGYPRFHARVLTRCLEEPVAVEGDVDLASRSAQAHLEGRLAPGLMSPISAFAHRDLQRFVDFAEPVDADLYATAGPDWQQPEVTGHVAGKGVRILQVTLDAIRGDILCDMHHFVAERAQAQLGEDFASGRFEQQFVTRGFRFLLNGRLRPLHIGGWFRGGWWESIFDAFEFPDAPPDASVDVTGRWTAGHETTVFVYAQSGRPTIRGAALDYARTLLFIRPNFVDALEVVGSRGTGDLRGIFSYTRPPEAKASRRLTFAFASTLDLTTASTLLGPAVAARASAFTFEHPPTLDVAGDLELVPDTTTSAHNSIHIRARSAGAFTAYRFPGQNLRFDAVVEDNDVTIDGVMVDVAGGTLSGHARIWGEENQRRLGFDAFLKDASLGDAITAASAYSAVRHGRKSGSAEKLLSGKSSAKIEGAVSAEGLLGNLYSYQGAGNVAVSGGELGQVRLLGLLSELFNFTALRFTAAHGDFKVDGSKLIFPNIDVTGANSAIHAHGEYALDKHVLDFNARVYPFAESKSLLQIVGAVLTPVSAALEVKLGGTLDDPKWAFVIGPTHLINSLSQTSDAKKSQESTPQSPSGVKSVAEQPMKTN